MAKRTQTQPIVEGPNVFIFLRDSQRQKVRALVAHLSKALDALVDYDAPRDTSVRALHDAFTKLEGFVRKVKTARRLGLTSPRIKYLDRLPKPGDLADDRVLVHNSVKPTRRAWTQAPDTKRLVVCDCGRAPELGVHYRVQSPLTTA